MFPERWCTVAEECGNSSLDMGRGEGLVEDIGVKQGGMEKKRWTEQEREEVVWAKLAGKHTQHKPIKMKGLCLEG